MIVPPLFEPEVADPPPPETDEDRDVPRDVVGRTPPEPVEEFPKKPVAVEDNPNPLLGVESDPD